MSSFQQNYSISFSLKNAKNNPSFIDTLNVKIFHIAEISKIQHTYISTTFSSYVSVEIIALIPNLFYIMSNFLAL